MPDAPFSWMSARRPARHALLLFFSLLLLFPPLPANAGEFFRPGARSQAEWKELLAGVSLFSTPDARIDRISELFLDTPYRSGTLIGAPDIPEELVADFGAVDCFTLLDYVEALRRSPDLGRLRETLTEVRYRQGVVGYFHRRHFFTDWAEEPRIKDVTRLVGAGREKIVRKHLNGKRDGTVFLPGIAVLERTVAYLPVEVLDDEILSRLQTGDYVGIFSEDPGLDVTHVGIVVRRQEKLFLRHASSKPETARVVDSGLLPYLSGKSGMVVLRPLP